MSTSTRSLKRPLLVVLAIFGAFLFLFVDVKIVGDDPRPVGSAADIEALAQRDDLNVLFILVDTLRAHRLGTYGYERDTSPTIDALAGSGARFASHLSQSSWTKCSMASMWTSLYPARSRITRYEDALPETAVLPAEILQEAGFRTTGVYRNGWVAPNFGFGQGFEVYERPVPTTVPRGVQRDNPTVRHGGSDDDLLHATAEFLEVHGHERWFLYLHLMDLHEYTYDEQSALFGSAYSDIYDNSIRWVDGTLDILLGHLADQGYLENTLIVIASDHGEAFGERGLEGHARFLYRETTEVPLIFVFPFKLEPGVVVNARTRNVDIWPTILDLLKLPAIPEADGRSRVAEILAAARGEPMPDDGEPGFAHLDRHWGQREKDPMPTVAVTEGPYRYLRIPVQDEPAREELFDAGEDPAELDNLIDTRPEVAARLRSQIDRYLENTQPPGETTPAPLEIDEMQLNQLRALGYRVP